MPSASNTEDKADNHECDVSFFPRRVSSDLLLVEDPGQSKSAWVCFRKNEILTPELLNSYIVDILKYCLTHRVDSYRIHLDRLKGAKLIRKVAHRTNYNDLAITQIVGIIWSSISVVHHFHIRIVPKKGYAAWVKKRQYVYALRAYEEVLLMLLPHLFTTVIQSLITFFNESKIWDLVSLISVLMKKLLDVCMDNETVVNNLLDLVVATDTPEDARNVLKVLYTILDYIEWMDMDDFLIARMLELYRQSAINETYAVLRSGFEACLRHAFKKMKRKDVLRAVEKMLVWAFSMDETMVAEFGNILEYAAMLHTSSESYVTSIGNDILPKLLELISSDNMFLSLLGIRVLYFMLERSASNTLLLTPRIFFQDVVVNITKGTMNPEDRRFLQNYHQLLYSKLMESIVKHGKNKVNLECTFAIVAVIAVEVPCGYTAAASVCFAMSMQEYALSAQDLEAVNVYHLHACVMFIMSLVCYVHNAKIFYDYVNSVLSRRAQLAPQLNPPLCINYLEHTIHLKKPELYFEDWEARYGLWKCFISSQNL